MLGLAKRQLMNIIEERLGPEVLARLDALDEQLGGRQTDDFGFTPEQLKLILPVAAFLYRHWFRAEVDGLENIPEGRVLLVGNHSGQIPIDAAMIGTALLLEATPPRAVRSMVERFVPTLPYVSVFFSRLGQVLGTPENCRRLLGQDVPVLVFPEGARGISKTYDKAYTLQDFGQGFMRLALETNTPIVPVGVVGAEEQYLTPWNLANVARRLGLPSLPLSLNFLIPLIGWMPLPVKYRIYFGRPMHFQGDPDEDESEIGRKVGQVKSEISGLIARGLETRKGIFS